MDKVGVVCHDAGGAEVISSWVKNNNNKYIFSLEGPAKAIFKRKIKRLNVRKLDHAINESDWLLCGTSWQSDLEKLALSSASEIGKRTVSYLDHWINYKERYKLGKKYIFPDEFWVGDIEAKKIAENIFPQQKITFVTNQYFADMENEFLELDVKKNRTNLALYVCEPIRELDKKQHGEEKARGYTEEEALKYFLDNVCKLDNDIEKIIVRPHPSEDKGKYDWSLNYSSIPIKIGGKKSLLREVIESDYVVGCESMAMVVGLIANRNVVTCIPPGGRLCILPHKGINRLSKIILK